MAILYVGIDLAKNVFAAHGVDQHDNSVLVRPSVPRAKLHELVAELSPCTIGTEACSGAHYRMSGKQGKNDAALGEGREIATALVRIGFLRRSAPICTKSTTTPKCDRPTKKRTAWRKSQLPISTASSRRSDSLLWQRRRRQTRRTCTGPHHSSSHGLVHSHVLSPLVQLSKRGSFEIVRDLAGQSAILKLAAHRGEHGRSRPFVRLSRLPWCDRTITDPSPGPSCQTLYFVEGHPQFNLLVDGNADTDGFFVDTFTRRRCRRLARLSAADGGFDRLSRRHVRSHSADQCDRE